MSKKNRLFISPDRLLVTTKQGKPRVVIGNLDSPDVMRPRTVNDTRIERGVSFSSTDNRIIVTIPKSSV